MNTSGMPPSQPSRESLMEMYKTIFDTWRSQVDSSWQRSHCLQDFFFVVGESLGVGLLFGFLFDRLTGQHALQVGSRFPGLRAVGLVHNHGILAVGQVSDLLSNKGKLL